ncbi:uncharacterized protein JCM10292_003332 [Rhodotorula paludigena]|uniref:uncharacterized protein n=1 Tax=Rhodotorula paludigena TaxID=86838 RepID=UPI0031774190
MQLQTAKQVSAFIAWDALAESFKDNLQHGIIKNMVNKVATWWGKGNPSTMQKFSAEALTLSLRDAPKMLAVDQPRLATQPSNAVVNASTHNDIVLHPSFQPAFAILRASALSIATRWLCPIADDEAIGADSNAISSLWTSVAHRFLREKIKDELARLNTAGLVNQPGHLSFTKSRSGLAFYARCTDCTACPLHEALSDVHHLRTLAIVMSEAVKSSSLPVLPPVRNDPIFGDLDFDMHGSDLPTAKLAVGILTQQHKMVSLVETFASASPGILSYRVTNSSMLFLRMKRGAFGDASISISERLAGGKNTVQSGTVLVYFTGADEKNNGSETFAGELATDPALGHLFLMAVYTCAEDLPEPGSSQRICNEAQQFFSTKGWLSGQTLSDFKSHVQDVISLIQQMYHTEFDRLVTLLLSCAVSLQPTGTGFLDTFGGGAGLDALHVTKAGASAVVDCIAELATMFNYASICIVLHLDSEGYNPCAEDALLAQTHAYGRNKTSTNQRILSWCTTKGRRTASRRTWAGKDLDVLFEKKLPKAKDGLGAQEAEMGNTGTQKAKRRRGRSTAPCFYSAQKCKVGRGHRLVLHLAGLLNKRKDKEHGQELEDNCHDQQLKDVVFHGDKQLEHNRANKQLGDEAPHSNKQREYKVSHGDKPLETSHDDKQCKYKEDSNNQTMQDYKLYREDEDKYDELDIKAHGQQRAKLQSTEAVVPVERLIVTNLLCARLGAVRIDDPESDEK